jgi:hypothetical protein
MLYVPKKSDVTNRNLFYLRGTSAPEDLHGGLRVGVVRGLEAAFRLRRSNNSRRVPMRSPARQGSLYRTAASIQSVKLPTAGLFLCRTQIRLNKSQFVLSECPIQIS